MAACRSAAVAAALLLAALLVPTGGEGQAAAQVQVEQALRQHFGQQLHVTLANHPPPAAQALLAQVVGMLQFAAIGFVLVGRQVAEALNMQFPTEFWAGIQEKRGALLMGSWFVGNMIRQNLISTGAFEVWYDGNLVFSKLETGRMPTLPELFNSINEVVVASG